MEAAQAQSSIFNRMIRAARIETAVYEEVEHDRDATMQAALVVVGTSIAAGIGGGIALGFGALILLPLLSIAGWAIYAWITYFIGTRLLAGPETSADWGELARTLGFANTPRALLIFGVFPPLIGILGVVVGIWTLITTVVAVRAALDFSTLRAIVTAIAGSIVQGLLLGIPLVLLSQ